ncbi:peptidoglycan DD-metalloendopeptidase family protein [Candidatus Bandiella euplotis]|uniref:NlpD murein hydrolase activator family protein n=1 Tax=Candidatus Bandiella euplotis TaxID=1664265 RepID=A0ABZ0UPP6_9RICK|nr:peptidoglycan DD-metalloendopeptidase family protein [Candidatus Bandiella woodruffii]WPX96974.1 NlpD murein hydrolase activator family protein [Candidatus Bandiella woodruffii]
MTIKFAKNSVYILSMLLIGCSGANKPASIENNQSIYYGRKERLRFVQIQGEHTVNEIAKQYSVPVRELTRLNSLNSYDILRTGQTIKIPIGVYHLVKEGDTLESVARIHDVNLKDLAIANHLSLRSEIAPGDYIKIPQNADVFIETKNYHQSTFESSEVDDFDQPAPNIEDYIPPKPSEQEQSGFLDPANANKSPYSKDVEKEEPNKLIGPTPEAKKTAAPKDIGMLTAKQSVSVAPQQAAKPAATARSFKNKNPLNSQEFIWPIDGKVVKPYGNGNDGINIAAIKGSPIKAAGGGDVAYTGTQGKYGKLIILRHNNGYMTAYAHLDKILVKKGHIVNKGTQIATVGTSGGVEQPQLQFSMKKGSATLNPDG